jgi:hypothetical protein
VARNGTGKHTQLQFRLSICPARDRRTTALRQVSTCFSRGEPPERESRESSLVMVAAVVVAGCESKMVRVETRRPCSEDVNSSFANTSTVDAYYCILRICKTQTARQHAHIIGLNDSSTGVVPPRHRVCRSVLRSTRGG